MADTYNVSFDVNNLPMGIDTSDSNGPINITKAGAPKLYFGAAKCGEGTAKDIQYLNTRAQYEKLGLPFIAYYVLRYAGSTVAQQVKNFKSWAGSGCYAYAPDLEKTKDSGSVSKSIVSANTRDFIHGLQDAGLNVLPYTSPGWINEYFRSQVTYLLPDWITSIKLWLAAYNFIGERSTLPIPTGIRRENVLIFQTWNKSPNKFGSIYDSIFIDRDRWIGGALPGVGQPPAPPIEDGPEIVIMHVVNTGKDGLKVRTQPNTSLTSVKFKPNNLMDGTAVNTVERIQNGSDVWRKRLEGGYCAELYKGTRYLI